MTVTDLTPLLEHSIASRIAALRALAARERAYADLLAGHADEHGRAALAFTTQADELAERLAKPRRNPS